MATTAAMPAAAGMRHRTTCSSTITITMHIAPPIIAAAKEIQIRLRHHHSAAVTSAHEPHTSCQGNQQHNSQPNLDSVNQSVRLAHTDLPFTDEIKKCGRPRNNTRHAVIMSPDVNSASCLVFMRYKITPEAFPSTWGVTLPLHFARSRGGYLWHYLSKTTPQFSSLVLGTLSFHGLINWRRRKATVCLDQHKIKALSLRDKIAR
jgi:hypothetical protein